MKNVLSIFQGRVSDIFSRAGAGEPPIAFRRLAKRALREMENETFVIDGIDTAPALYTILVSADDDRQMRPFYVSLTAEISALVEAQAKKRGYSFVGQPLVRFMIDPSLKVGKYAVFAENIDPRTLARLRDEENAFLGISDAQPDAYQGDARTPEPQPQVSRQEEPLPEVSELPDRAYAGPQDEPSGPKPAGDPEPAAEPAPEPETVEEPAEAFDPQIPTAEEEPPAPEAGVQPEAPSASCTLTDQQTGEVYTITSATTPIGRERVDGALVLRDPNVSRRHAELTYRDGEWHISDLGSTNGTLVNDIDIEDCSLRDGDIITIGLLNFVFRES